MAVGLKCAGYLFLKCDCDAMLSARAVGREMCILDCAGQGVIAGPAKVMVILECDGCMR